MSPEGLETINKAYRGFAERDLHAILDVLAEDIKFDASEALVHRGVYHGHAGIAQYMALLHEMWDDFRLEMDEVTPSVLGSAMVVGRQSGIEHSSGDRVEAPFIHVLTVKGQKITRIQVYVERERAEREMQREETLAREVQA